MPCCKARQRRRAARALPDFAGWKAILHEDPDRSRSARALAHPGHSHDGFWYLVSRLIHMISLDRFRSEGQRHRKTSQERRLSFSRSNHQSYSIRSSWPASCPGMFSGELSRWEPAKFSARRFMRRLARSITSDSGRSGCQPDSRHARRRFRAAETDAVAHSLSRRRTHRSTARPRSSRRARPFSRFTCRCRSFRWRLKASTMPGRAAKRFRGFAPLKICYRRSDLSASRNRKRRKQAYQTKT